MANKELRSMNRAELIEIIYALQQEERSIREENEKLHAELDEKILRLDKAGSIAEAALGLNHIFEDAEAAAQQYLDSLRVVETEAARILENARQKAEQIVTDAEERARQTEIRREQTEQDIQQKREAFIKSVNRTVEEYAGLVAQMRESPGE
ncbi:MAG: hypothetical protein LUD01_03915 [Clostridiales bacterium]|nr:hypothetical protein [Clostridiales bacterium]